MKSLLLPVALLGFLATVFADTTQTVKWCVTSDPEQQKCLALSASNPTFQCVRRESVLLCIVAIKAGEADAITVDGGDIYTAGLVNYNLVPVFAEDYGSTSDTCYYAVAVARKGTGFNFNQLRGKKTCHTGLGKSAGWNIPIGTLVSMGLLPWSGIEDKPLTEAVSEYFSESCVPGADPSSNLCRLCKNPSCPRNHNEPYYDYDGAFRCLKEDAGHVAFVKHLTVPDAEKANYELLCKDNTRAPIENYQTCHLARVPAHAVVSRKDPQLIDFIWNALQSIENFDIFSSEGYGAKNLMFKDSTMKLVRVPPNTDSFLYLGAEYVSIVRSLKKEPTSVVTPEAITWCAVGHAETSKCDLWAVNTDPAKVECQAGSTVDECLEKIMSGQADAMSVDGGQVYTAGKCGLVPAMVEQYDRGLCNNPSEAASYYAVAVVKKDSGVTWDTLKGKRSCHTGMGRTAGWNIPMGHIHREIQNCNFNHFFPSGCAPGAPLDSSFCQNCAGNGKTVGENYKCQPSAEERYYGYAGALRCLVEGAGDVAFIKHTTITENSDGNGPAWASGVRAEDFELICPGKSSMPITEYRSCHLAKVPAHAVVTRPDVRNSVVTVLKEQQEKFGRDGTDAAFRMFESQPVKNLLFKDSTQCLQEIPLGTRYDQFLGTEYMNAMGSVRECSESTPDIEKSCTFHTCQQKN